MLIITLMIVAMLGSALAQQDLVDSKPGAVSFGKPTELQMLRGASTNVDLRTLPKTPPEKFERPEREEPDVERTAIQNGIKPPSEAITPSVSALTAPAPAPIMNFDGLDFANWGAGHPPDTNGDVGPTYYIQTINTSIGIFRKSDGVRVAAFTFNTLMSQAGFGDVRATGNFGDPVVLYDTFEDRWIITDFAFSLDGGGNVVNPPGNYQVFAVSKTGDPVTGGWNFYSVNTIGGLGDYPKLGIWPDGLYMSVNMFNYSAGGAFQNSRVYAFNKEQMYAGNPSVQVVSFNAPSAEFTILPANARLQTGTPPPGSPNYFSVVWQFLNVVSVYKFHVDWYRISTSTFTGPFMSIETNWFEQLATANQTAPTPANRNDELYVRLMVQNQYSNIGGVESLWTSHTVGAGNPGAVNLTATQSAVRYYQVKVTGGTVEAAPTQAWTHSPDASLWRYMPSVAVDRAGDMAIGYTTSNAATNPALQYAGRLAGDPLNSITQTEQLLFQGTGAQQGNCGSSTCTRWGDYSAMTLDPDGCTFWYTNEYYATTGLNHQTRIGSFAFPSCTPVGAGGTVSGTVTATVGGAPLNGVTIQFGARSTTTNGSGFYSFLNIPAGTYPSITASLPGYTTATSSSVVVTDGGTTTKDFSLGTSPTSACLTDTTQADFLTGIQTNVDLNTSPGDLTLSNTPFIDQQNTAGTMTGTGFGTPNWTGQSFIAAVTGQLVNADVQVFCNGCGATPPNLTLSVRNTSAGLPTGADLATATIPGSTFASGATVTYTASFGAPITLSSGTQYALILRPVSAPAGSGYFWIRSSPTTYANGSRVLTANSGSTWSADTTRDYNFKTYMQTGYAASGDLVSGLKDSNPAEGLTPIWSTLSWNASTPANTTLKFQIAASNSDIGPFNFVGPDGTAATFFTTSPVSLDQFYGLRYLQYKSYLTTTDGTQTPALNDVTLCYSDTDCSGAATITPTPAQVCENSIGNTASGPAGATSYSWSITNGTIVGSTTSQSVTYTSGASGSVGLMLNIVEAGGCHKSSSTNVTINPIPATPTITPGGPTTFCAGGSVTLTSSSATGNQWYLNGNPIGGEINQTYGVTAQGDYTVIVTMSGCSGSASAAITVTVNPTPSTPTITPKGSVIACDSGTLTSSSATGNQWYFQGNLLPGETNQTLNVDTDGDYTVIVTVNGCSSAVSAATSVDAHVRPGPAFLTAGGPTTFCAGGSVTLSSNSPTGIQWFLDGNPLPNPNNQNRTVSVAGTYTVTLNNQGCISSVSNSIVVTVNPTPATPTITLGGPTTFCAGGSVTLTSSGVTGNQWYLNNNPIGGATNQSYVATASGNYTVTVTASGCTSAASAPTTVTVNPIPATPTVTPGGPTTFCAGGSVTLTSSSATGNQWYLNGNSIGGETNQTYVATASGNYTVVVTTSGCSSAPSSPTTVTVNPIPATPTVTPGGPTTFCAGGSVTLTSSSAAGDQWYLNGNPIGGATNQNYAATASGNYAVTVTSNGCASAPSAATTVTVNPIPATPTITPGGPTSFCPGGSVMLTSSSASGNQWYLNGNPIGGATNQQYNATASGNYTVKVTTAGCTSASSASITVTVGDTTPPTITCPPNQMVNAASSPAMVTYPAPTVSDNCSGVGTPICSPASGSLFPAGTTTVSCNVSDGSSNMASCQFTVTVSVCTISCPMNITTSNSPNLCGAVVTFTPTTSGGACGTVTCTPSSGSLFPKGTTTVTCTTAGPSCSFTVTVNDTQPPVFLSGCAAAINKSAPATCPFATSLLVNYTTPIATDNCGPAPTVMCNPPSGSVLPVGTTTVTCTATDSSGNTATCSFPVNVFSFCLQDDSSDANTVFVNALTGDYLFCQNGVVLASGRGTLTVHGCNFQIDQTKGDRKVHIQGDTSGGAGTGSGTAYIQKSGGGVVVQITDRKMTNDACLCSPPPPPSSSK